MVVNAYEGYNSGAVYFFKFYFSVKLQLPKGIA